MALQQDILVRLRMDEHERDVRALVTRRLLSRGRPRSINGFRHWLGRALVRAGGRLLLDPVLDQRAASGSI